MQVRPQKTGLMKECDKMVEGSVQAADMLNLCQYCHISPLLMIMFLSAGLVKSLWCEMVYSATTDSTGYY